MYALFKKIIRWIDRRLNQMIQWRRFSARKSHRLSTRHGQAPLDPTEQAVRRLVFEAAYAMPQPRMHAGQFGGLLRQQDPTFSYEKYRATKLIDLLESVPEIVQLDRIENAGGAPAYYVEARVKIKQTLRSAIISQPNPDDWIHHSNIATALLAIHPPLSARAVGFDSFQALLATRRDLLEINPESPDYFRLAARQDSESPSRSLRLSNKLTTTVHTPQPPLTIRQLAKFARLSKTQLQQAVIELASVARPERWYFGPQPPADFAYPILKSYLRYTFIRIQHEGKLQYSADQQYAAFCTGLLDPLLRPIYALLTRPAKSHSPWGIDFGIAGEGPTGKQLTASFSPLPAAANYLSDPSKIIYHHAAGLPEVDWTHVIKDNMERLPAAFLAAHAPANFTPRSTHTLESRDFHRYKRSFAAALDADPDTYRTLVARLEGALSRTLIKAQSNYRLVAPTYYPNLNSIDLLLPVCLLQEGIADCAIVARQSDSGKYIGHTILTMRQAYNNARLICRLDEHWLYRAMKLSQSNDESAPDIREASALS